MESKQTPAVKATVREFAEQIEEGISPSMKEMQIAIAVELLREQHGILVTEAILAKMVG